MDGEVKLVSSVQVDMRVARLTPVTRSLGLLRAFEDAQNTVHRPLASHFWQVIYLACVSVTTAHSMATSAFDLWRHYSGVSHQLITSYQQAVMGYEKIC